VKGLMVVGAHSASAKARGRTRRSSYSSLRRPTWAPLPRSNGLCGLPAGAATCSGEAPHALLFDTARGATPDELATLFQHAAAFRYDARQYAADARLGEGGDERARVRLHTAGRAVSHLSPRTRAPVGHT